MLRQEGISFKDGAYRVQRACSRWSCACIVGAQAGVHAGLVPLCLNRCGLSLHRCLSIAMCQIIKSWGSAGFACGVVFSNPPSREAAEAPKTARKETPGGGRGGGKRWVSRSLES
jgi:hypothetical protein